MVCPVNKIDSNVATLAIAEEECPKQLPAAPVWYFQEPNSYNDFGAEISTVARSPIDPTRQRLKGTVSDIDATGGFTADLTKTNMTRLMQGFLFADARQDFSTQPIKGGGFALTNVDDALIKYEAADGLGELKAGDLLYASGFTVPSNNGFKKVSDANNLGVIVWGALVAEVPPAAAKLDRVGHEFAEGDVALTVAAGIVTLTAGAGTFNNYGFTAGQWVFLGGDATVNQLAANIGYARILNVAEKTLTFDMTTFAPVANLGAGIALQMFWGTVIRNEPTPEMIKRRTYQLERQLGRDAVGVQSEYITGAVPNELTVSIPTTDKITVDLTFVGLDAEQRTGTDGLKGGTRVAAKGEDAYNTSTQVYRQRMYTYDPGTTNPTGLFGYISEAEITLTNNVSANKAVGVAGGFDTSAGTLEVGGTVTAYFTNIAAIQAIRQNRDVGFYTIVAGNNSGVIFDLPLVGLGGGQLNIETDSPITIPIENNAYKSKFGYTVLTEFFAYLPNVAQPK